jgi:tRNA nucleotidyltransferase/poly(A) polymerase
MMASRLSLPPKAHALHDIFAQEGEDLRAVGGCVRDMLLGEVPKDFDFCTTADPFQQVAIYVKHGIKHIPTGIKHGTISVVIEGETFEITTLRTESEHDGRHATVAYTRDWIEDASRRDLTINAMSLDFNGTLHDPFGGESDLGRRRIRFVGDPEERMREDFLRILRFLRFQARFNPFGDLDEDAEQAILRCGRGLKDISAERVWSEVSRMLRIRGGGKGLSHMMRLGIAAPCGMFTGSWREVRDVADKTHDPVTLMVAFLQGRSRVEKQAENWKWSNAERNLALFLADRQHDERIDYRRLMADEGHSLAYVRELAHLHRRSKEVPALEDWRVPEFPLRGQHLIEAGMKPGPLVGHLLDTLRARWADTDYSLGRDELLAAALKSLETQKEDA